MMEEPVEPARQHLLLPVPVVRVEEVQELPVMAETHQAVPLVLQVPVVEEQGQPEKIRPVAVQQAARPEAVVVVVETPVQDPFNRVVMVAEVR
jgi:hypothetical protein